jgi:hypothetical protein
LTQEHKNKIKQSKLGIPYSVERNQKISQSKKGKPSSISFEGINKIILAKSKPILQYDLNGVFIKEWSSGAAAAKELKLGQPNINLCCNGKTSFYKGYRWEFKKLD